MKTKIEEKIEKLIEEYEFFLEYENNDTTLEILTNEELIDLLNVLHQVEVTLSNTIDKVFEEAPKFKNGKSFFKLLEISHNINKNIKIIVKYLRSEHFISGNYRVINI